MKPKPPPRHELLSYWTRLALCLLFVIALHVPFLFMKGEVAAVEKPVDNRQESSAQSLPPPCDDLPAVYKEIYKWADMNDPTLLILPHKNHGFAHFVSTSPATPPQTPASQPLIRNHVSFPTQAPGELNLKTESLAKLLTDTWNHQTPVQLPKPPAIPPQHGVFWLTGSGRILANPPDCHSFLDLQKDPPENTTTLEIIPQASLPLPRIIIRKSCGDKEIDMVAVNAARVALSRTGNRPLVPGSSPQQPLVLVIDWHL